jgi:hypothetical protein
MSEILREVDEELRRERFQKLWERYGIYIVGIALAIVLSVASWRAWEWYSARQAAAAGAQFQAALELADAGNRFEAEAEFNRLGREGTAGYRLLARFRAAAEAARTDAAAGVSAYDAIAADGSFDTALRDLARLHAGRLLVDTASPAEISARLDPLTVDGAPFRSSAREAIGLAHFRAGQHAEAAKIFGAVLTDPEAPPGMRNRIQVMHSLVSGAADGPRPAAAPATQ